MTFNSRMILLFFGREANIHKLTFQLIKVNKKLTNLPLRMRERERNREREREREFLYHVLIILKIFSFLADCSEAPEGRLEADVTYGHERFPATVKETNPKVYQITFHPRGKGTYKVWLVYSGLVVKGKNYFCTLFFKV